VVLQAMCIEGLSLPVQGSPGCNRSSVSVTAGKSTVSVIVNRERRS
jgi:hypothetical protein